MRGETLQRSPRIHYLLLIALKRSSFCMGSWSIFAANVLPTNFKR
jgi:hypothetical protein